MKRWTIALNLLCTLLVSLSAVAHAAPAGHKKGKAKKVAAEKVPESAEISKSMNDLTWGMTKDELEKKLIDKVKEKYRPLVAKTKDAVEEDRLRQVASDEIKRIRDSFVEFKGTSTGWDVSFLRGEFTHGNGESMLVMRDQNSQNFYFFIHEKLWKWYKAFDSEVFRVGDFAGFAKSVQKRFGPAKDASGELYPGAGQRHWLEWQDDKTRLRAVDQSDFYGFYCLVFEERSTVGNLAKLRTHTRDVGEKQHALVDAVTAPASRDADNSPDVVDRITGKLRAKPAPASSSGSSKGGKKQAGADEPAAPAAASGVAKDDDPLRGLGL
ncbi:MAG: hypothetical protein RL701_5900 [Pseudomonadota bacterium]|jgi:hypothetical protein